MNLRPPVLIIAIDSETSRKPELGRTILNWSSPDNSNLEVASLIAVLYDPDDFFGEEELGQIAKGFPSPIFTERFEERISNVPAMKPITSKVYVADGKRSSKNLVAGYRKKALSILKKRGDKNPSEATISALVTEIMKDDITRDIVTLADRVKYTLIIAQNLNFDFTTMISKKVLDASGWRKVFYVSFDLNAGGYLKSPMMPGGDFAPLGTWGMFYKDTPTHVKTIYLGDTFTFLTYSLRKVSHFFRLAKYHVGNLNEEGVYQNRLDSVIQYNLRDVEILLDEVMHYPDLPYRMIAMNEKTYKDLRHYTLFSTDISRDIYQSRYVGDKRYAKKFADKIRGREPGYKLDGYFEELFAEHGL